VIRTFAPEWGAGEVGAVLGCVLRGQVLRGGQVRMLEERLSRLADGRPVIAVDSGRGALYAILRSLGLPPGSEVIAPTLVCEVAIFPILRAGLKPVFVDCLDDLTMDPQEVEYAIGPATRVLLMAHIYGKMCDAERLERIASRHGLVLIDDAAQVLGARYAGRALGTYGDFGIYSFNYKQVCSLMGGAIIINRASERVDPEKYRPRRFRRSAAKTAFAGVYMALKRLLWRSAAHRSLYNAMSSAGIAERAAVEAIDVGAASNMCAAVALKQLDALRLRRQRRIEQAQRLSEMLEGVDEVEVLRCPRGDLFTRLVLRLKPGCGGARLNDVRQANPARMFVKLAVKRGVEFQRLYEPFHLRMPGYRPMVSAEQEYARCVIVPNHTLLTDRDLRRIAACIKDIVMRMGIARLARPTREPHAAGTC